VTERFYPKSSKYFAKNSLARPVFQGDIFHGAFGAFWPHPAVNNYYIADEEVPTSLPYPSVDQIRRDAQIRGKGYAMILPQPCDYSEGEKGDTHPFRVVAPLVPLNKHAGLDHDKVRNVEIGHVFWVPTWKNEGPQDYFVDLRWTASIDRAFITREMRVAALSPNAWLALVDSLSRFFIGVPLASEDFALEQAALHPDYSGIN
jgi:hypothetical protein